MTWHHVDRLQNHLPLSDHGLPTPIYDARLHTLCTLDGSPMIEFIMGRPSSPPCLSPLLTPICTIQEHAMLDTPPSGNASSGIHHSPCVPSDVVQEDDHGQTPPQMSPEAKPQGETEEGPLPVQSPVISVPPRRRQRKAPRGTEAIHQDLNSPMEVMKRTEADCKCEQNARCTRSRLETNAKGQMSRHCRQSRCHLVPFCVCSVRFFTL